MPQQPDLFGQPLVPGLSGGEQIVTAEEEAVLIARIDAEALAPFRFQGWLGKRLTHSFGWSYDFEDGRFAQAAPLPNWLLPLRDRAARFARLEADVLVQALLIRYDPGAGIGWHRNRPVFEHVVGVSLGSAASMRLQPRGESGFRRLTLPLAPRSVYHLSGEVRHVWEHSITPMEVPRWSVTFRSLAEPR